MWFFHRGLLLTQLCMASHRSYIFPLFPTQPFFFQTFPPLAPSSCFVVFVNPHFSCFFSALHTVLNHFDFFGSLNPPSVWADDTKADEQRGGPELKRAFAGAVPLKTRKAGQPDTRETKGKHEEEEATNPETRDSHPLIFPVRRRTKFAECNNGCSWQVGVVESAVARSHPHRSPRHLPHSTNRMTTPASKREVTDKRVQTGTQSFCVRHKSPLKVR